MTLTIVARLLAGLAVLFSLVACSPIKVLDALTPRATVEAFTDLAYGQDPRQRLDVYRPPGAQSGLPVVVFFYGGSWNSGSRSDYRFVAEALASRGLMVVIADYRLYPQVRYPEFLKDSARALAWAREHAPRYGGDAGRLFVMGHSAGAYNAAMLALDPRLLAEVGMSPTMLSGWIGLAGPYDFLPIENPDVKPVFWFPDTPVDSQPINHVSASSPPALLIAAKDDPLVDPQRNTAALARRLRAEGVAVDEHYYSRPNHITLVAAFARPLRSLAPVVDEVVAFVAASRVEPAVGALQAPGNAPQAQATDKRKQQEGQP